MALKKREFTPESDNVDTHGDTSWFRQCDTSVNCYKHTSLFPSFIISSWKLWCVLDRQCLPLFMFAMPLLFVLSSLSFLILFSRLTYLVCPFAILVSWVLFCKLDNKLFCRICLNGTRSVSIIHRVCLIEFGSFHVKSTDFWPFFHGPPPILLKFGTLVGIV